MGMGWPGKRLVGPAALFANTRLLLVEPAFMRQPMAALLTLIHGRHQQKLTEATPNINTEKRCIWSKFRTFIHPTPQCHNTCSYDMINALRATQSNA